MKRLAIALACLTSTACSDILTPHIPCDWTTIKGKVRSGTTITPPDSLGLPVIVMTVAEPDRVECIAR